LTDTGKTDDEVISLKALTGDVRIHSFLSTARCVESSRIKGLDHVLGSLHELKKHSPASHRKLAVALITVFGNGRQRASEFA
jgi:hypothetical protein